MLGDNNTGWSDSPEAWYRVVFGPGDVHRYTIEMMRVRLCTPGVAVAVAIFLAITALTAARMPSPGWAWAWVATGPAYLAGAAAMNYWLIRRVQVHVVGPGMSVASGGTACGLVVDSHLGRDLVPWSRITGVRVRRGIAVLTLADPKTQILLPAELLPPEMLAWVPADVRPPR